MQAMLLWVPSSAKDVAQSSWSMYVAVGLRKPYWIASTMVLVIAHVGIMKMLELFAKVS